MATLTNPINAQNIVDRFADYVVATANAGIIYHSTNLPFPEFTTANGAPALGVSTGRPIAITGPNITPSDGRITASNIYNALVAETNRYTSIRNLRARRLITGGPGNRTRNASDALDVTAVAHFAGVDTIYQGDIGTPANGGVASNQPASDESLEAFFNNLRSAYNTVRGTSILVDVSLCHNSCHASCHTSRGRR